MSLFFSFFVQQMKVPYYRYKCYGRSLRLGTHDGMVFTKTGARRLFFLFRPGLGSFLPP